MDISKINLNGTKYNLTDAEVLTSIDDLAERINLANLDLYSYGVAWNDTATSSKLTRVGNPTLHRTLPILSQYKGCIVKNGVLQYYLDPNNWNFKEDGTPSVLDGTDGDVCVNTPKFYYRSFTDGNKRQVRFSMTKIDDTWNEMPEAYVGACPTALDRQTNTARTVVNTTARFRGGNNDSTYDTYLESDKCRTLLGKPATKITRADMRTYARKNGTELLSYDLYKVLFYWAYVIEYANFNCQLEYNPELTAEGYHQGGLGLGVIQWNYLDIYNKYNPITPCGYGRELGNRTGIIEMTIPGFIYTYLDEYTYIEKSVIVDAHSFKMPRWRGFDNPFGDIYTNLDGIAMYYPTCYIIIDPLKYTDDLEEAKLNCSRTCTMSNKEGEILTFDLGIYCDIVPKTVGGMYGGLMRDSYVKMFGNNLATLIVGVAGNNSGGLCQFDASKKISYSSTLTGFRTIITL